MHLFFGGQIHHQGLPLSLNKKLQPKVGTCSPLKSLNKYQIEELLPVFANYSFPDILSVLEQLLPFSFSQIQSCKSHLTSGI